MSKVMKSFICRSCLNPVTSTGCKSVDIGASANLELVDKFCYSGHMLMLMQLWRPEFELDAINSGSWYTAYQYEHIIMRGRLYSSCVQSIMLHVRPGL